MIDTNDMREFLKNNELFKSLSENQLDQVLSVAHLVHFKKGDQLIKENDVDDNVYLIKEGNVEISKWDEQINQSCHITTLTAHDVIGEVSILDKAPRSASAHALTPTTTLVFSMSQLQALGQRDSSSDAEVPSYYALIRFLATALGKRIRKTNEAIVDKLRQELEYMKIRVTMGRIIIVIIASFVIYTIGLTLLQARPHELPSVIIINISLIAIVSALVLSLIFKSDYPLSLYGITLKNWRTSVKEGLLCALLLMVLSVACKWLLIHTTTQYANSPLFDMRIGDKYSHVLWLDILWLIIYLLFVPFQELIVRGALQGLLQEFLVGPAKVVWAILLSNATFSIVHFHISMKFGLMVFIPGLFWGLLYARNRSLIGVSLSHQIIGIWGLGIVGF